MKFDNKNTCFYIGSNFLFPPEFRHEKSKDFNHNQKDDDTQSVINLGIRKNHQSRVQKSKPSKAKVAWS